jgi:hypothetical protein
MSDIIKYEGKKQEIDYFKSLCMIASKGGTSGMSMENMMNIMLTAKDLGISPMKAINGGFYIVNGKIGMSTAMMADRIRKSGHSIKIPEWDSKRCVVIGIRKDNGDSIRFEYTMEDAQSADLLRNPTWKKFPKQMLYNRAMATLARTLFPDVVGNAYSEDEKWDILNVSPDKRPLEDPDLLEVVNETDISPVAQDSASQLQELKNKISEEGLAVDQLESYVQSIAEKKGKPVDYVIGSALIPELFGRFKQAYAKEIEAKPLDQHAI